MTERLDRERDFHNTAFTEGVRKDLSKYYQVGQSSNQYYNDCLVADLAGRDVLEYGCGPGSSSFRLVEAGAAKVVGIDISDGAIDIATGRAAELGHDTVASFLVMDAEHLDFADASFDQINGTGILHHLDLEQSFAEVARVLRPGGQAIFSEPLSLNPAIRLYRKLTPKLRTEDEHPLERSDFEMLETYFGDVEVTYFNLVTLATVPLRKVPGYERLRTLAERFDQFLFTKIPGMKWMAWTTVMVLRQPRPRAA